MVSEKFVIENEQGLHMRPATLLVKAVKPFDAKVNIIFGGKTIACNIMQIIAACIKQGSEIEIQCDGEQETEALEAIKTLAADNWGD